MSSLHRFARMGRYDEVAECLARGLDVNGVSVHHFSPLMLAAREGHLNIVRLLLKSGADTALAHPNRRTALHFAASSGHLEIVQALVAHGAPVDALSGSGRTPAIEAAQFNQREVVAFLQEHGADLEIRDRQGFTAEDRLAGGGVQGRFKRQFPDVFGRTPRALEHAEREVRRLMAEGLSADEFAAKHGRRILVWSYGYDQFEDVEVQAWAHRVAAILFTPGLLDECEEQFLQGDALEDARKCRARRTRREARGADHR